MKDLNWYYILLGAAVTVIAQIGAWFQHNLQFKYPDLDENGGVCMLFQFL